MPEAESKLAFITRGGARVGMVNFTWPLARLDATCEQLTLTTTMFGLFEMGRYTFTRAQITSIERYSVFPLLGTGIRIVHSVADYPQKMIFWCRPDTVLAGIAATGFTASAPPVVSGSAILSRGFPFRWPPLIALVVIWNSLLGYEFFSHAVRFPIPGPLSLIALLLLFTLSVGTLRSAAFQSILLKPGRSVGEVRPVLLLIATVSGLMAGIFSLLLITGALKP